MRCRRLPLFAALSAVLLSSTVFAEGNSEEGRLRALNAQGSATCTWGASIVLAANTTSYTDPALSFGWGTYKYQVRAGNTIGNSVWIGAQVSVQ